MKHDPPKWAIKARQALKQKGITFKDVGVELGLSESMVSRQLAGKRNVNMRQIKVYTRMLGMSLSELIGEDAVFITDDKQLKAVELIKEIPEDKKELALRMLEAFLNNKDA